MSPRMSKIGQRVSVGFARPTSAFVELAEIEVRVMQSRIQRECVAVGLDCFIVSIEVFEKTGEVEG